MCEISNSYVKEMGFVQINARILSPIHGDVFHD